MTAGEINMDACLKTYTLFNDIQTSESVALFSSWNPDINLILNSPSMKGILFSSILSSYKKDFEEVYTGLTGEIQAFYPRERLEEATTRLQDARDEILRNFMLLVSKIISNKHKGISVIPVQSLSQTKVWYKTQFIG
jgi:hypothetical protein